MNYRIVLTLLVFLLLSACGPIIGQMMKASEGISQFEVTSGSLTSLRPEGSLLVYGPFAKTSKAFYISRGEDAANFAAELQEQGVIQTRLFIERDFDRLEETAKGLRDQSPEQIKSDLALERRPDILLFGTILHRKTIIAPARGVIMDVGYRLEFYDLGTRESTIIEVSIKDLAENCIPRIVEEIVRQRP
ncbi:hypothetical protein DSOUD_2072 [Desulfuromonas soudanensis]|uniref:Lipoprotein n=1 Tax=Desulfuromonas soudanensis TaxID=1603606 RepID=A0A0M3QFU5_9BACT|nr:hypothetical protein [Desulfuromonas soudanensis]ALC16839.1 hypothetical protein DSOUD_2072 [Desulfuromonas soudanensis]